MPFAPALELSFDRQTPPITRLPWRASGFCVEHVRLESASAYDFHSRGESHYLAIHDLQLDDGELRVDGLPLLRQRDLRDSITFVPKGCAIEGWSKPKATTNAFTALHFEPELIREEVEARYKKCDPPPFAYARDAALESSLRKLERVIQADDIDDLQAESLCLLASLEVFGVLADPQGGRISDRQLRRITDYVEAHLSEPLTLAELAAIAGLSRFHFSRAFKATAGVGPQRFVQARRIARATELLRETELASAAVGQAVGYKSASQFRRAFGEETGISPQGYRARLR